MLRQRVITSLWCIPLVIAAIWFDKPLPWFTILVAICGVLGAFEFYRLVNVSKVVSLTSIGVVWTLLFILSPHFYSYYDFLTPLLLTSAIVLSLLCLLLRPQKRAFLNWAWTMAGILYLGWLLSYLVALRGLDDGRNWVFLALFITFASDSSAFFVGKAVGRHYLAPPISPHKTWEGAIAGVSGAILASQILVVLLNPPLSYGQAILLSLLVSIFGQLGDLVKSVLKRNVRVKDSGKLLPGHGGILDRLDSVVFAGVVVYYYVIWSIL